MSCPLDGIRVLDLSRVLAGPWASQTLADLGAEVIKVERPGTGDDTRSWGPPYATDARGKSTSDSAYFLSTNRGKKSVAIDITDPQGQNAIRELARTSDVLIENFKVEDWRSMVSTMARSRRSTPGSSIARSLVSARLAPIATARVMTSWCRGLVAS